MKRKIIILPNKINTEENMDAFKELVISQIVKNPNGAIHIPKAAQN